jgi:predicted Zn-dependent peptidase
VLALPWLVRRGGAVLCYVATAPDREAEAREAMLAELARVVREPPDAAELERARNSAAGTLAIRKQSGAAVAGELAEAWVTGTLETLATAPDAIRRVSADDVVRVAASAFEADRRAEFVVRGRVEGR